MSTPLPSRPRYATGLTLIELIVSLVLVGVLSSITAVFLRVPMQSYFVSRQRIDLTDSVELSMRHMDQELRAALPNSVRASVIGGVTYIEFLASRGNATYRTVAGGPGAGACGGNDQLSLSPSLDNCFTTLGAFTPTSPILLANDYVVIGNPSAGANAYTGGNVNSPNKSRLTALPVAVGGAAPETLWRMTNVALLGAASPLIYIVSGPVTYACEVGVGQLVRYSGYAINPVQAVPPANATRSVIASNLVACGNPVYSAASGALMEGIVSVQIRLQNTLPAGQEPQTLNFLVQAPVSKTP